MIIYAVMLCFLIGLTKGYVLNEEECLNYTVYPVQYDLTIIPYIFEDQRFYYNCEITITVIANAPNVNIIELDAKDFIIQSDSIQVLYGNRNIVNAVRPFEYDKVRGKLYIYLSEPLLQYSTYKTQYHIKLIVTKHVKYDTTGVFIVRYDDGGPKYMVTTRLSPNKAKYFFPCFDNPQFETLYKLKIYQVMSMNGLQLTNTSMVIAEEQKRNNIKNNYIIIDYLPSPQVALYQVGFHYSQFGNRRITSKHTNDTLVIWSVPSALKYYTFILEFGETIINLIHDYSSVKRPLVYGPINIVAVPKLLHGYEIGSWNLLTNGDTKLAYVPEYTSIKQREMMIFELSQQLCRIWLGNPGESERTRWKEEWFKEGIATYLAYYFLAQYNHGAQSMQQKWFLDNYGILMKNQAMTMDWHHSTPALINFNRTLAVEIPSRYKNLVAMKTASILWMVENWLGSDKFHQALVKYINIRRGQYISVDDFMTQLDLDTVECLHQFFNGSTASKVLNSWFHRQGYPVVNVQVLRDRIPNAIQLKQRQFSFTGMNRVDSNYLIPISYVVQNNQNCFNCYQPRFTIGMQSYTFEENLNGGWIILNQNASGYYRINYDIQTWKLIAKALKEDRLLINELNRAQIVNDILALYVAGDINYTLALEVLDYLDKERSDIVWRSVMDGYELLKTEGARCEMTRALHEQWEEFMRGKVAGVYNRMVNDREQNPKTRLFRSHIVEFACAVKYHPCVSRLRRMFNEKRIEPDTREACYYLALTEENNNIGGQPLSRFEQEDWLIAEHKMQEESKFFYRIPIGISKPMPIIMSTASPPILVTSEVPSTTPRSSSLINTGCTFSMIISVIVIAGVR